MPERFQAEGILDAVNAESMQGKRVLIPRAAERAMCCRKLCAHGALGRCGEAYRTVVPATAVAPLVDLLEQGKVDVITFTSSSTVSNFVQLFGNRRINEIGAGCCDRLHRADYRKTVADLGGQVDVIAREFTIAGLVDAMVAYFKAAEIFRPIGNCARSGG